MEKSKTKSAKKTKQKYYEGIGRRKTAIARVRLIPVKVRTKTSSDTSKKESKSTSTLINEKPLEGYFKGEKLRKIIEEPFKKVKVDQEFQISAKVSGGGIMGQAQAVRLGIARALKEYNPDYLPPLKSAHLLTRDPRMKERKKPGKRGARRGQQWSKR